MAENPPNTKFQKPIWRILQNTSWSLSGKALGAILSLIYLAIITRSLGPTDFGRFALIFSFAQVIAGIVAFPTWQIIIRYGTKYVLDQSHVKFGQLISICLAMDVIGLLIGGIVAAISVYGFSAQFGVDAQLRDFIMVFTLTILLSTRGTLIGILRVHDRFRDAALADSLVPIIRFVGVSAIATFQPDIQGFLVVWALSEIMATIIMWVITLKTVKLPLTISDIPHVPNYYREYPDLTRFTGFSNFAASLRVLGQQLVVLIVGLYTGPAAAGFFRLGYQLGQVLARISDGLSIAFYAEYNRMTHNTAAAAVQSMIGKTIKITAISAIVLLALLLIAGKSLITAIFGPAFAPAYLYVILLGGAAAVQVGSITLEPVLLAKGYAGWALLGNLIGTIVMFIALFLLIPQYDAGGAAIAMLLGALTTAAALAVFYRKANRS